MAAAVEPAEVWARSPLPSPSKAGLCGASPAGKEAEQATPNPTILPPPKESAFSGPNLFWKFHYEGLTASCAVSGSRLPANSDGNCSTGGNKSKPSKWRLGDAHPGNGMRIRSGFH